MRKIPVHDLKGKTVKQISVPAVFDTPIRPDIIKKAVVALQSHRIQPQGRDPMAGKRTTAIGRGTGLHLARIPRVKGSGYSRAGQGAFAPGTVGGRQAHPPKAEKRIKKRLNEKEKTLAITSAIAATADKDTVASRGHAVAEVKEFPVVVSDKLQTLDKAVQVKTTLEGLGVWPDVLRVKNSRRIRAGRGSSRGRKMKQAVGPLIIVSEDKGIGKAARNHPGLDVVTVGQLNVESLAPGAHPGRLTVWVESAIKSLEKIFA